jgi:ParB-like chromosome segregation protein Spo0J
MKRTKKKATGILEMLESEIISISSEKEKIEYINIVKKILHKNSPFKSEPVDCVLWVPSSNVVANDYNPNSVAPPEMELLRHSINNDGYTQPVVTWLEPGKKREVVDGFHRTRVCLEFDDVRKRVKGYLPVVSIKEENSGRNDRISSTIRHNRARGKHQVDSMSEIVIELKKRNWTNNRISKELGMDNDEILRLCQISGLTEMFSNDEFSKSWNIEMMSEEDMEFILDEENIEPDKDQKESRILHTYDKWECYPAGFYELQLPEGMTKEDCERIYAELLSDIPLFENVLKRVIRLWKKSCEHYLTNDTMNRIAWLGQAALCYKYGIPSCFRNGYNLLSKKQQEQADLTALKYLNIWLKRNGMEEVKEIVKTHSDIY